ncbi:class I SAM-dependent methyltransferase [Olsenella sp. HMSC062G07]|uniref:class I SAM-dependent methyltransferase n=1 Tax=Olsenella sp. HMSC062G07 TaxID=1739330 RepID=UPI0008A43DCE|nr:class I SAM-dependent methyltransferase [Olsenella sp. HMSC062G07]OFK22392.1 hypothetical protein HMPREF2826_01190 [Olsenella sp. HMSC062G07]
MGSSTARLLVELNRDFYRVNATSFSRTRQGGWQGWERALRVAVRALGETCGRPRSVGKDKRVTVLDVACGNMRLARYLGRKLPFDCAQHIDYLGIDGCAGMVEDGTVAREGLASARGIDRELIGWLFASAGKRSPSPLGDLPAADAVACFGLLHHVPTAAARQRLMRALVEQTVPGGVTCVSLWRFLDDPRLASAAETTTRQGLSALRLSPTALETGDRLLGWEGRRDTWRYCHSFSTAEVDDLAEAVSGAAELVGRFRADGRGGALNEYLILRRTDGGSAMRSSC